MQFPAAQPVGNDVGGILKQRVAAQPHQGKDAQRQQRHRHHYHLCGDRQMQPHQLRVAHDQQQSARLHSIAGFQQSAQELAGIRVVGRDGVDIAVFLFLSHSASL